MLCEANFAMQEAFDLDILQAISDPYREAADAGLQVTFPDDSLLLATEPLLKTPGDLDRLRYPKPEDGRRMTDRVNAVRLMHEKAGGQIPVMGWVEGALAEAADVRGVGQMMTDLIDRPEWVRELLERMRGDRDRICACPGGGRRGHRRAGRCYCFPDLAAGIPRVCAALRTADLCRGP